MELSEVQDEAKEQKEQAEGLEKEAAEHKEQISQLEKNVRELKSMMSEMSSDQIREAESSLEEAKRGVEKKLEENREEKRRLETRNSELREKLTNVNNDRRRATTRLAMMEAQFSNASDEFKGQIRESIDSLNQELGQLANVEDDLIAGKKTLDSIDI
jgi:chromosome segregation ATPase